MATKNTLQTKALFIRLLKEKKQWALLTSVILLITVVILPILLEVSIREEIIIMGLVEVFIISFLSTLIDFNYLHDTRKYGYYLSKPLGNVGRLHLTLAVNLLMSFVFIGGLGLISILAGHHMQEVFLPFIGWHVTITFLTALGSVLSGNTFIAALATWFNFALPVMFVGVIFFALEIVSEVVLGMNVTALVDYFVMTYYRLDIIYFSKFSDVTMVKFLGYLVYLIGLSVALYSLTRWCLKRRLNEKIGEFIIFPGFKNFVAMMFSLLIPYLFILIMPDGSILTKLIAFVLLASITYYVAMVILEKSFRLKPQAIRFLVVFMVIFVLLVMASGLALKWYEKQMPIEDEVTHVIITNSLYFYDYETEESYEINDLDEKSGNLQGVLVLDSEDAIEAVLELQASISENPSYHSYVNFNIIYILKDGQRARRYYTLQPYEEPYNTDLDHIADQIESTSEFMVKSAPFVFDSTYRDQYDKGTMRIYVDGRDYPVILTDEILEGLSQALSADMLAVRDESRATLLDILPNYGSPFSMRSIDGKGGYNYGFDLNISHPGERDLYYYIPDYFTHTRLYLEQFMRQ